MLARKGVYIYSLVSRVAIHYTTWYSVFGAESLLEFSQWYIHMLSYHKQQARYWRCPLICKFFEFVDNIGPTFRTLLLYGINGTFKMTLRIGEMCSALGCYILLN